MMANCPVCKCQANIETETEHGERLGIDCPACGSFNIRVELAASLRDDERPRLSHRIRKMQRPGERVEVSSDLAERLKSDPLPGPSEQEDNFLLFAGDSLRVANPVDYYPIFPPNVIPSLVRATIGAYDEPSMWVILRDFLQLEGLAEWRNEGGNKPQVRLTSKGWQRYDGLKRSVVESRFAFMAMPFNDALLDRVFDECFKPAVAEPGYELRRITDGQRAGLIDDQLRVAIRQAKITIAELTSGNKGVYWEAGFGEGLGRHVVYTCEKSYWDNSSTKPHFDINHY